jgi:cell division protein FtsB
MDLRVKQSPALRVLASPEESLRNLVERAPEAEAWADHMKENLRPTASLLYSIRRRLATGAVAILTVWLFVHVMFGANGMVVYRQKKTEYDVLQQQITNLTKDNDQYSQQINSLENDPKTIEKEAREQLHYARPGEVVYVSPPPPAETQARETNAARK